ncbi:zinc ribbon domain-containing protein [Paenibacillus tarimensis]|uniref:zinc ribbon domain-containing protein n=1 Tax=Paenibacillus tarimensis TaxID=416012 RepID=UPI001F45AA87|nr:zinc-ribbon domain-containing protein [Paenibacillus tarimensis]MCF2945723.1 zinc-ribbon domain-containing protein [Paenibacillus tarimensis]
MTFCRECGTALSEGAQFCKSCGTSVTAQPAQAQAGQQRPVQQAAAKPRAPLSRKSKIRLIAGASFIILLAAGYLAGAHLTGKERLIAGFEQALNKQDAKSVAGYLTSTDDRLVINEESVAGFMRYLDSNPDAVKDVIASLQSQSSRLDENSSLTSEYDGTRDNYGLDGLVVLEKKGKQFLVFDKYELTVEPVYITVETNYKDVSLLLGGKELAVTDKPDYSKTFGPYAPGIFTLEAKLNSDIVELSRTEDISLVGVGSKYTADLYLDGQDVSVYTTLDDTEGLKARLFLNDKDTGVNPFEQSAVGPVLTDGSMEASIEVEYPWGTMKSGKSPIEGSYVEINLADNEDFQQGIIDIVVLNTREFLEAFTSGKVDGMTTATEDYKAGLQESVDYNQQHGYGYAGKYIATDFDLDSFQLYRSEGVWYVTLNTREHVEEDHFYPDEEPALEELSTMYEVTLVYDETAKTWLVELVEHNYGFSDERMVTHTEEKPALHTSVWAGGGAAAAAAAPAGSALEQMQTFMTGYLTASVDAINNRDFSYVSPLMEPSGPAYKESADYIVYLEKKGITEELLDVKVQEAEEVSDGAYEVTTAEHYTIFYEDGTSKNRKFISKYKVVFSDTNGWLLHTLINTDEQV